MEFTALLFALVGLGLIVYPVAFACRAVARFPGLAGQCCVLLGVWQFMVTVTIVSIACDFLSPGLANWPRFLRDLHDTAPVLLIPAVIIYLVAFIGLCARYGTQSKEEQEREERAKRGNRSLFQRGFGRSPPEP